MLVVYSYNVMDMKTFKFLSFIPFFCAIFFSNNLIAQETVSINKLWEGIGGKAKWDETHFILFSASGNSVSSIMENPRKFLINRKNGDSRFEGSTSSGDEIVLLFNYKTNKIKKLYLNEVEQTNLETFASKSFPMISEQFKKDISLLFLPTILGTRQFKSSELQQKIVDTEKLTTVSVNSTSDMNVRISGKLYFNSDNGRIRRWDPTTDEDTVQYLVDNYKDIGAGLILPTTFKSLNDNNKSVAFTTVAAFVDMELTKFSSL